MATRDGEAGGPPIALWWIGEGLFSRDALEPVRAHVATEFASAVTLIDPGSRPEGTFDPKRGQHSSRAVLTWLVDRLGAGDTHVLAITDVDLFIPVLTFVFGEAQLEGRAAVVSSARLIVPGDERRTRGRLLREALHELGHTYGLLHCDGLEGAGADAAPCVMSRSASVRAVDAKSVRLCTDCRARYRAFQQDGSHVYRQHQNPDRR